MKFSTIFRGKGQLLYGSCVRDGCQPAGGLLLGCVDATFSTPRPRLSEIFVVGGGSAFNLPRKLSASKPKLQGHYYVDDPRNRVAFFRGQSAFISNDQAWKAAEGYEGTAWRAPDWGPRRARATNLSKEELLGSLQVCPRLLFRGENGFRRRSGGRSSSRPFMGLAISTGRRLLTNSTSESC